MRSPEHHTADVPAERSSREGNSRRSPEELRAEAIPVLKALADGHLHSREQSSQLSPEELKDPKLQQLLRAVSGYSSQELQAEIDLGTIHFDRTPDGGFLLAFKDIDPKTRQGFLRNAWRLDGKEL